MGRDLNPQTIRLRLLRLIRRLLSNASNVAAPKTIGIQSRWPFPRTASDRPIVTSEDQISTLFGVGLFICPLHTN